MGRRRKPSTAGESADAHPGNPAVVNPQPASQVEASQRDAAVGESADAHPGNPTVVNPQPASQVEGSQRDATEGESVDAHPELPKTDDPDPASQGGLPQQHFFLMDLVNVIREAVKALPALVYIWGVIAAIVVIAMVRIFSLDYRIALFGTIIVIILMYNILIFKAASNLSVRLQRPGMVQAWFALIFSDSALVMLLTSAFIGLPLNLKARLDPSYESRDRYGSIPGETLETTAKFGFSLIKEGELLINPTTKQMETASMNKWLRWLFNGVQPLNDKTQFLVVDSGRFTKNYYTFICRIKLANKLYVDEAVAFLERDAGNERVYRPAYRQMAVRLDEDRAHESGPPVLTLDNPSKDERLRLFLKIKSRSGPVPTSIEDFNVRLEVQQ
jgi:hypothetical protein